MRIVSLLPSATEILFAIGAGPEVVGVTHECDFPNDARRLPILTASSLPTSQSSAEIDTHVREHLHAGSGLYTLNREMLASLEPDLIVTQELCAVCAVSYDLVSDAVKRLRSDTRIVSLEPSSLAQVFATITTLGEITGHSEQARDLCDALNVRLLALESQLATTTPKTMVLLEWTDPPMTPGHWTPEVIERAGAQPLLGNANGNSKVATWDEIAQADPDVIVIAPCGFDLVATRRAAQELEGNQTWRDLRAHRQHEVYLLDGNAYVNRPGPRLVDTAEFLAAIVFEDEIDTPRLDPTAWEPLHERP